jgi:hypothetical protein
MQDVTKDRKSYGVFAGQSMYCQRQSMRYAALKKTLHLFWNRARFYRINQRSHTQVDKSDPRDSQAGNLYDLFLFLEVYFEFF